MYGIGGRLLEAVKSFYRGSTAKVRVNGNCSESFEVSVGLRQGCVVSPWLLNVYMDGVVREAKAEMLERGVKLRRNGREWEDGQMLFADDTALDANSSEKLRRMIGSFARLCTRRKLKVNVGKSKVVVYERGLEGCEPIRCGTEELEEVNSCLLYTSDAADE